MVIKKKLHDDKKEKHSSIELTIIVPTMEAPKCITEVGGYSTDSETEYHSYHGSFDEANQVFKEFIEALSSHFNRHKSTFTIEEIS